MTIAILDYYRLIDPLYGNQAHQREFVHRMDRAQDLHPCTKEHAGENPPTHSHLCYPVDRQGRMAGT